MIVAVDVVVIAGELGLSLYLIISVSTYAGVREQRARGRNVSDPNATSGHEHCASPRPCRRRTRQCCWWHLGSYPYRICRCRCRCRCLCLFSSHCEPSTVTGLSRVKPQLQPSATATAARVASSSTSESKVKPHLQQSAAATAARIPTEARVTTAVLPYPRLCTRINPSRCS